MDCQTVRTMKAYIHTDIEGVAGWVFYHNLNSFPSANWHHTQRMNRLLTDEVLAAVEVLEKEGADEIFINDAHGQGYSILFEDLPESCRIIHGRGGQAPSWTPFLDKSIDLAIAIGQHAMAGTVRANCNHSIWFLTDGDGREHRLSETTMFGLLAGYHGVPLVMVSGDDFLCREVEEKIPGCASAAVKVSLGLQNACTLSPRAARRLIAGKVLQGIQSRDKIKPYKLPPPYRLCLADRNPDDRRPEEPVAGDDIWQLMHTVCNRVWANYGNKDAVDDRSYRWPPA